MYQPPAGQNGNVAITYGVRNQCEQTATGTITIDVNQSPNGQNISQNAVRGQSLQIAASSLGSDSEPLSIASSSGAPSWVTTAPGAFVDQRALLGGIPDLLVDHDHRGPRRTHRDLDGLDHGDERCTDRCR